MSGLPSQPPADPDAPSAIGAEREGETRPTLAPHHRARTPQGQAMFVLTILGIIVALIIPIVAHLYRSGRL